jgi:hypothetical protein
VRDALIDVVFFSFPLFARPLCFFFSSFFVYFSIFVVVESTFSSSMSLSLFLSSSLLISSVMLVQNDNGDSIFSAYMSIDVALLKKLLDAAPGLVDCVNLNGRCLASGDNA